MGKRAVVVLAIAAVVAPPTAAAAPDGDTEQPENPGCFGELASLGGQLGIAGEFVRANAERYKDSDESIGNTGVPFLKFVVCPGDYRGRDGPD
jgi:hypothetical protein